MYLRIRSTRDLRRRSACLTANYLDLETAKAKLAEALEQLLNLAEDLGDSQRN